MADDTGNPIPPPEAWPVDAQTTHGEDVSLGARFVAGAVRAALWTAVRAPERLLDPTLRGLAAVASRLDRGHAAGARDYVRTALPDLAEAERERLVRGAYYHLGRVALDVERLPRLLPPERWRERFTFEIDPEVRALRDAGQPVLAVGAHAGDWEAGFLGVSLYGFRPLYGVWKPVKNRFLSEAVQRAREARGLRLLPRRGAMADAPRIVAAGGSLALLLDQRARLKPIIASFFGRPARCDRSAGVLIKRLGVPLVFGGAWRGAEPLTWTVRLGPVLVPEEVRGLSPEQIAERVNRELERMILREPTQVFWLHDRYRDAPASLPDADDRPSS